MGRFTRRERRVARKLVREAVRSAEAEGVQHLTHRQRKAAVRELWKSVAANRRLGRTVVFDGKVA